MTSEFHALFRNELVVIMNCIDSRHKFFALEHCVGQLLVVTATDHENSGVFRSNLDHLKVVREVVPILHELVLKFL